MTDALSAFALDALGEVSNIGSGNAANALSQMLGTPVDLDVPAAHLVPLADATGQIGQPEQEVVAVLTGVTGGLGGSVLLVFSMSAADTLCTMLGTERDSEMGMSALQEIGNILTSSYVTAIGTMANLPLEPMPPFVAVNMLGALVDGALAMAALGSDAVLLLRTALHIEGTEAGFSFLFVPEEGGVAGLLGALGIPV